MIQRLGKKRIAGSNPTEFASSRIILILSERWNIKSDDLPSFYRSICSVRVFKIP
ncbi:hypothetical protein LEP1GSC047_4251 [Leptospira inadai serovar Lyme str. 10]|uniref:Uncharacterized protein n=1 Tax=Leptospira inadai serovar Lyme str. 10 TaxID=1049790 RepID=V6HCK2_9LEPT|nr:hypothetical protein LEP1GSC047_4251 [Leptospira inadai serovar Lyme str. 10]